MSRIDFQNITCPRCGRDHRIKVWSSLNAELNPLEKQSLLDGTFFRFECECSFSADIDAPLLYNDMTHQVMVYYVDEESVQKTQEMFSELVGDFNSAMAEYRVRIVTDKNVLREKAVIFDLGLDDRVLEIVKLFYITNLYEQRPNAKVEKVLFFTHEGKWYLQFMGADDLTAELDGELYQAIQKEFSERLQAEQSASIDLEWARQFLVDDLA